MRYNQLGRTGLFVSEICLGTMTFGEAGSGGIWGQIADVDQSAADALIARAVSAGVNFFDTADVYSMGKSEEMLGHSLRNLQLRRQDVVIATKCFGQMSAKPNDRGASRGHIMDSVEASLKRMQLDYIDLYQIHQNDTATPLDETLRALDDLISRGLVRYAGVSNWPAWRMARAIGVSEARGFARIETAQAYYSIAGRDLEREIAPLLKEERLGLMVWSPLAGGLLSGKYAAGGASNAKGRRDAFDFPPVNRDRAFACIEVMREVGGRIGASIAEVALAYVLAKPFVTSVIIGAKRMEQLEQNLAAVKVTLDAGDMAKLDAVSNLPAEYPGWMTERHDATRRPAPFEG